MFQESEYKNWILVTSILHPITLDNLFKFEAPLKEKKIICKMGFIISITGIVRINMVMNYLDIYEDRSLLYNWSSMSLLPAAFTQFGIRKNADFSSKQICTVRVLSSSFRFKLG